MEHLDHICGCSEIAFTNKMIINREITQICNTNREDQHPNKKKYPISSITNTTISSNHYKKYNISISNPPSILSTQQLHNVPSITVNTVHLIFQSLTVISINMANFSSILIQFKNRLLIRIKLPQLEILFKVFIKYQTRNHLMISISTIREPLSKINVILGIFSR